MKLPNDTLSGLQDEKEILNKKKVGILESIVMKLATNYESIYYLSTIEIASLIHEEISKCELINKQDQEIVKDLGPRDIQILLSYHKNS